MRRMKGRLVPPSAATTTLCHVHGVLGVFPVSCMYSWKRFVRILYVLKDLNLVVMEGDAEPTRMLMYGLVFVWGWTTFDIAYHTRWSTWTITSNTMQLWNALSCVDTFQ